MRLARVPGALLHHEDIGAPTAAAPLVLVHSLGTDFRLWDALIERWPTMLPSVSRVVRFDLRGHGLSSCPTGPWTIDDLVDDTAALLDGLGVERAIVVGVSLGGLITQGLAARRPDLVRAMVPSNSAATMGTPSSWAERIEQIERDGLPTRADSILERWFAPGWGLADERLGWRHLLERTPQAGYTGCCRAIAGADLRASTATLTLPTLAIAGALDEACTPDEVKRTAALVRGATFACIDAAAHLPCVETPDTFVRLLRDFIDEQTP